MSVKKEPPEPKLCDNCESCRRFYSDGYVFKDWSGRFEGDLSTLPNKPDNTKFWTYMECSKKQLNLDGRCNSFRLKKA